MGTRTFSNPQDLNRCLLTPPNGEISQSLVVAVEWGWLRAAVRYGQRRSGCATQPGLVRLRGPAGAENTRWVPSGGGQNPAYKKAEMQARRTNDVRMKTAATLARANASARSANDFRQMMAESQRKIAAMSQQGRQRLMEKMQAQANATLARTQQARDCNVPVRDYAMKAPERGLPRSTHTAGVPRSRQPSNTTQAVQPISAAVRAQHSLLMSTAEYREATSAMLSQHGWSTLPAETFFLDSCRRASSGRWQA